MDLIFIERNSGLIKLPSSTEETRMEKGSSATSAWSTPCDNGSQTKKIKALDVNSKKYKNPVKCFVILNLELVYFSRLGLN